MFTVRNTIFSIVFCVLVTPVATAQPLEERIDSLLTEGVWLEYNAGLRDLNIWAVTVDPTRPTRLFAGGEGYLYRSLNGGESWEIVFTLRDTGGQDHVESSAPAYTADDIDDLSSEQLDAVSDRFEELEQELYQRMVQEYDEYLATLIVDDAEDDLLEQALEEILAEEQEAAQRDVVLSLEGQADNLFTQIVVDPDNSARVFAASGRGLYRSDDHGATWVRIYRGNGRQEQRVTSVAFGLGTLLIGTGRGAYLSTDRGETWMRVTGPPSIADIGFIAASATAPQYMVLTGDERIYRSRDSGLSWFPESVPPGVAARGYGNLIIRPDNSNHFYLATADGVQFSPSGGSTFQTLGTIGLRERQVLWITIVDPWLVIGTVNGLYVSRDDGQTWTTSTEGLSGSVIHQIAVGSENLWIATDRGVFRLVGRGDLIPGEQTARQIVQMWASEPSLGETVQAALAFYGYADIPVEAWLSRIWWSRFLPNFRVQYTLFQQRRDEGSDTMNLFRRWVLENEHTTRQNDEEFQAIAWLDLQDLVVDSRESTARGMGERLVGRQRRLVRRVIRLYQSRRELIMRMTERQRTTLERQLVDLLTLQELTAQLDVVTGGFFSAFTRISRP